MSGLAAALSAGQAGACVLVLEKSADIGGNANLSAGMFLGATDAAALHRYIPDGDPKLQRMFCATFPDALRWLTANGLPLEPEIAFPDFRRVRPMRLGSPGRRASFMTALAERVRAAGCELRLNSAVRSATVERESFRVRMARGEEIACRRLVLATGGFQGDRATLSEILGDEPASALMLRSRPESAGDGLRLARALGAGCSRNLDRFYGHLMPDCPIPPDRWQPATPYFSRQGILINRLGRRFTDEAAGLLEETNPQDACRQPDGIVYLVFDDATFRGEGSDRGTADSLPRPDWFGMAREFAMPLMRAADLDDLGRRISADGANGDAAVAEVRAYNEACREDRAGALAPPRSTNAIELRHPPYFALRCRPAITATAGGVAVDDRCRALMPDGRPVRGLYAAGVDAGGVYGRTYGGFLAWSLVSGLVAGRSAVGATDG
jgi:succinate dehydrogenase/fumarate reductase flavoprotein subunit